MKTQWHHGSSYIAMEMKLTPYELLKAAKLGGYNIGDADQLEEFWEDLLHSPAEARRVKRCAKRFLRTLLDGVEDIDMARTAQHHPRD